jgi:hypothetical protein
MLTYLTGSVQPGIAMATHQCARFSVNPMRSHKQVVIRIGQYLLSTKEKGMVYKPDSLRGIEVFVDADFAGSWDPADAMNACLFTYRLCYFLCRVSNFLAKQASNGNSIINSGSQVHCIIPGSEGDDSYNKSYARDECDFPSLSASTKICS